MLRIGLLSATVSLALLGGCAHGVEDVGSGSNRNSNQPTGASSDMATVGACYDNAGECNPLSKSCDSGYACDLSEENEFVCYWSYDDGLVGAACDPVYGPFCRHGAVCIVDQCYAYCCSTDDCHMGSCEYAMTAGDVEVRVCQAP